jgi:hypothetical protein
MAAERNCPAGAMPMNRVRVRRDHPYAPAWTLVMLLVALTMYLVTEGLSYPAQQPALSPAEQVDWTVGPLSVSLVVLSRAGDEASARIEAARYVSRGAAGYILPGTGEYLIVGAGYDSADEAEKVLKKLAGEENLTASLAVREAPELHVRLTGARAQVQALMDAEAAFRAATASMGEAAFSLDAGTLTEAGAREALLAARAEAKRARETLERAAGDGQNAASQGVAALLSALEDAASAMLFDARTSPLFFSSQMKYNYIDLRLRHIGFINRLAAG